MQVKREQFSSRLGVILAAAGSAVGIGNIVGFPVNATKNGGAAFLLVYALFVVLLCLPVMVAELSTGRHTQRNPVGAYRTFFADSLMLQIGGWLSMITPFMIAVFYMVITVWIFGFFVETAGGNLRQLASPGYFGEFITSDRLFLYLLLTAAVIALILHGGVARGIERASKIMMPALFIMLVGLVLFGLTRDNAMAGVKYYLIPDFSKITPQVISGALSQAFFSLSLGMGILITYGSYISRDESIPNTAKMVALTDTMVAFTAGLLILPAIFSFNPNTNTAELSDSSISLIFTFLPKIFLALQTSIGYLGASIVAGAFFLLVLFAAITSQVSILQVPLAGLMDEQQYSRNRSLLVLAVAGGALSIACILSFGGVGFLTHFATYAGQEKSLFDVIIDIFYETILPLNGFLICLVVIYHWKKEHFNHELEIGDPSYKGTLLERYINLALGTYIPAILLLVFINTVALKFFGVSLTSVFD